jgi:TATA-binding protein-associated factor Taf7
MIMRFPEELAEKLHAYFDNPDNVNCPDLEIEIDPSRQKDLDPRLALKVQFDQENYKATVMELPTISSTFKTVDRINFFKSNDISEMIMVHDKYEDEESIR